MNKTRYVKLLATLILALSLFPMILSACASQTPNPSPLTATPVPPTPTSIERDYWPTEGWRT
ncbi:hypothetical protein ACFLXI_10395, partial [Chloroflexota bacterium]